MDALVPALTEERGNIQQHVFDRFPAHPATITVAGLCAAVPWLARESLWKAVRLLQDRGAIERVSGARGTYRRVNGAERPTDGRGRWKRAVPA